MHEMASESGGGASERASGCCDVEGDASGSCEVGGVCGGTELERMGENGRCWGCRWEDAVEHFVDTFESGRLDLMGGVEEVARGWDDCRGLVDNPSLEVLGGNGVAAAADRAGDGCFRLSGTSEGGSADWKICGALVRSMAIPTLLEVRDGPCVWATW